MTDNERPRAVVLLSSGLDSTVNLVLALRECDVVLTLTFDYGQRSAGQESSRAALIAERIGVRHERIELPWFRRFTQTALVNTGHQVPVSESVQIDDAQASQRSAKAVWVPNRNGIFLNIAAGFAEGMGAEVVVPGFNIEEAQTFPDNSQDFLDATTGAFSYSTGNRVKARCFTTELDKTAIVRVGRELGAPFDLVWPCYLGGDVPCGACESCQRFARAFANNGLQWEFSRGNQDKLDLKSEARVAQQDEKSQS